MTLEQENAQLHEALRRAREQNGILRAVVEGDAAKLAEYKAATGQSRQPCSQCNRLRDQAAAAAKKVADLTAVLKAVEGGEVIRLRERVANQRAEITRLKDARPKDPTMEKLQRMGLFAPTQS